MADGSINFDVRLNTNDFKKDMKNMAGFTQEAVKTLDEAISAGALSGISGMEDVANSAFSKLMEFSKEEKDFLINNSKSAQKTEEERQQTINTIRRNAAREDLRKLSDEEKLREDIINRELKALKNSLEIGTISQQEYYLKLREFRDKYFAVGSEEWEDYTIDILKYCKDTSEAIAKEQKKAILGVFEELSDEIDKSWEELSKTQDKMTDKLKNYGNLFYEESFTSPGSGHTYSWLALGDMERDIAVLKNYNNALIGVKELLYNVFPTSGEGLSQDVIGKNKEHIKEFFEILSEMDLEEGGSFAAFLTRMPYDKAEKYLTSWSKKQNIAEEISKNLYSDQAREIYDQNIDNMAKSMVDKLEETFGELPDNFFDKGVSAALGFGEGFMNSIEEVFRNIKSKIEAGFNNAVSSVNALGTNTVVNNSTSYNIYGTESAKSTALEIYKQDTMKRMLVGDS